MTWRVTAGASVAYLLMAQAVAGQAWVRPAGSGSITVATQTINVTGHVLADGSLQPAGKSRSAAVYFEVDYAISNRVSIAAGIPFVFIKYLGPPPPAGVPEPPMVTPVDQCYCWQTGLQDFGATVRYNLTNGPLAVTASVSVGVPSHAYEYRGEAVVGRNLNEFRLAVDAGKRLDAISHRLAVQGRYAYTFVEKVLDVPNNRSNASVTAMLALSERVSVEGRLAGQITHGGLQTGLLPPGPGGIPWGEITTPELFAEHDRLLRDNYWHAGAGASYSFSSLDLFVSYEHFIGGSQTHSGRAFTAGIVVPFAVRQP